MSVLLGYHDLNHVVLNTFNNGSWGVEEKQPLLVSTDDGGAVRAFKRNVTVQILITAEADKFVVSVNCSVPSCYHMI